MLLVGVLGSSSCSNPAVDETEQVQRAIEPGTGATDSTFNLANEPAIAVNPINPNNIVFAIGPTLLISNDGGATFPVVGNASIATGYFADRDSALAFDSRGRLFIGYLLLTGGPGRDVFVQQIDPSTGATVGATTNVTGQLGISSSSNGHDKPWIAIDRNPGSPHRDRLYVTWVDGSDVIRTAHADSPGTSWSGLLSLSSNADCPDAAGRDCFPWPPHIAVGKDGAVYLSYRTGVRIFGSDGGTSGNFFNYVVDEHMVLFRSDTGGSSYAFSTSPALQTITTNTGNLRLLDRSDSWTLGAGQDWILPNPGDSQKLAIVFNSDPTPSPDDGPGFDDADVYIIRSSDRGASWTTPVKVSADSAGPLQLFPTGAWDSKNDCLTVAWFDGRRGFSDPMFRNSSGNVLLDVIIRMSSDGGATFGPEFQVNDNPMNPDPGEGNLNAPGVPPAVRIGEYFGVLSRRGAVWPGGTGIIDFDNSEHKCSLPSACLLASNSLTVGDSNTVTAPVTAGSQFSLGLSSTITGDVLVGGNGTVHTGGVVNGNMTLRGTLSHPDGFTVTGTLTQNDSPIILKLQTKTFSVGSGSQSVAQGATTTLAPGNYGTMTIGSNAVVTLLAGTYNFASLNVGTGVHLVVKGGGVNVNIQGDFTFGDSSQVVQSSGGSLFVYSNGNTIHVGKNLHFVGVLVAPHGNLTVYSQSTVDGCVGAQDLTLQPNVKLNAGALRLPVAQ
jgi:hypothetical protein